MAGRNRAATIKDVAKLAGVSLATVSRVVNKENCVSPALQERVIKAIAELNYNPNHAARALVQRKTGSIGIVVNNLHDPFFYDLIRGFEAGAQETKYNVVFCSVPSGNAQDKEQYVKYLTNGVVDAVILYGSYVSDEPLVHYLVNETVCDYVVIENNLPDLVCNQILIDNAGGARKAVEYLIKKGHTKIAHLCGDPKKKVSMDRLNGYLSALRENGIEVPDSYISTVTGGYRNSYEKMRLLMQQPQPPTAVFCSDDAAASFAVRAAMDMGLRVPEDVSVMGFDNQTILPDKYLGPAITSVEQPLYTIGKESIQLLTKRLLSEKPVGKIHKVYATRIIEKDTVQAI